jgi:hypothetical protein
MRLFGLSFWLETPHANGFLGFVIDIFEHQAQGLSQQSNDTGYRRSIGISVTEAQLRLCNVSYARGRVEDLRLSSPT